MVFSWCNLSFPILWNIRNFLCNFLVSLFSIGSCWELFQYQKLLLQTSITGRGESTLLELKDWTAWINLSFITKPHTSSGPSHLPTGHFEMWGTSEIVSHGGRREIFLKIKFSKIYLNLWLVCSLFLLPQPCHEMISSSFLLGWTVKWSCRSFALWMLCCESSQLLETAYVLRIMCVWSLSFSSFPPTCSFWNLAGHPTWHMFSSDHFTIGSGRNLLSFLSQRTRIDWRRALLVELRDLKQCDVSCALFHFLLFTYRLKREDAF